MLKSQNMVLKRDSYIRILVAIVVINLIMLCSMPVSLAYTVDISSYDAFRNATIGKAYDIDGEYGAQCWDGAALLWQQLGRWLNTGDGRARGTWLNCRNENAGSDFNLIYSINDVKRGDVVVFDYNANFNAVDDDGIPFGHIAFADNDYTPGIGFNVYGQNQVGVSAFSVQYDVHVDSFLGAFRLKRWNSTPASSVLDVNGYLDGELSSTIGDYGTFDIDVNGTLSTGCNDYYNTSASAGAYYQVNHIVANPGYKYNGYYINSISGSVNPGSTVSGTVESGGTIVVLSFSKVTPTAIALGQDITVQANATTALTVSFTPTNTHPDYQGITWRSSDTSIATVDSAGVVTGISEGTATITAVSTYNPSLTASCTVIVSKPIPAPENIAVEITGYDVHISWDASELIDESDVRAYNIKLYAGSTLIFAKNNVTDNYIDLTLMADSFRVAVTAVNTTTGAVSTTAQKMFTVENVITVDWQYSYTLPSNVSEDTCDIEYKHTYRTTGKTSPGTGWTQVSGSGVTTYENSGSVQGSPKPLTTSDTFVLVGTKYYHYCGSGSDVNYYQTSQFYDAHGPLDVDPFEVTATMADGEDSAITIYRLRWRTDCGNEYAGQDAYCAAGRSCLWYKQYLYQPRVAVTIYTWTKTDADWMMTKDDNAYSIQYRFRLKDTAEPTVESASVTSITPRGYTITCAAADDTGITKILFSVWTDAETIENAKTQEIVLENAEKSYETILTATITDHSNAVDSYYNAKIAVYDSRGNVTEFNAERVYIPLIMHSSNKLVLPDDLREIQDSAFEDDIKAGEVIIPDGTQRIGSKAFAGCGRLVLAYIPDSVTEIANDAFDDCTNIVFICSADSAAANYAKGNDIHYITEE